MNRRHQRHLLRINNEECDSSRELLLTDTYFFSPPTCKANNGFLFAHPTTVLCACGTEPENAYSDFSNIGRKLHNSAGCVTNIGYSGAGFSENMGLTWNGQYQLTEVMTNGTAAERNGYDALGRRVWNWDGTETNFFVYAGSNIIAEVDSTGGLRRSFIWGPGVDNLLAMTVHTGATPKTYYAITDHLKSVHALLDENGSIVESYRFDAWGRIIGVYDGSGTSISASAIGNRYLWQGREYSWASQLYFFRTRFYDSVSGRWLSNDTIGITGGLNQYLFCGDNPGNGRDPSGCFLLSAPEIIIITVVGVVGGYFTLKWVFKKLECIKKKGVFSTDTQRDMLELGIGFPTRLADPAGLPIVSGPLAGQGGRSR